MYNRGKGERNVKMKSGNTILFTDRNKVCTKQNLEIEWIDGQPPKFIFWDGKLWEFTGMGMTSYFYHEVESFVQVN